MLTNKYPQKFEKSVDQLDHTIILIFIDFVFCLLIDVCLIKYTIFTKKLKFDFCSNLISSIF